MRAPARPALIVLAAVALATVLSWNLARRPPIEPRAFGFDFVAFYCAGSVASAGHDPYRTEPLRTCEHRVGHAFRPGSRLAVPAPVPGYDLAAVGTLARLPYSAALPLWLALQLAAYVMTIVLLVRLTGHNVMVVTAATALGDGFLSILLGQLVPLSVLGICIAATAAQSRRPWRLAVGLALAAVEPHLAAPAILGAFLLIPRARIAVASACIALAGASLLSLSPAENLEYLRNVLPAHALSEIANQEQYSLAYLLHLAGATDWLAERLAEASYAASAVLGIWLARRALKGSGDAVWAILIPAAAGLAGGPFVHIQQFAAAMPLALYAASKRPGTAAAWSVVLLAVPWGVFFSLAPLAPLAAFVPAYLAYELAGLGVRSAIWLGAAAFLAIVGAEIVRPPLLASYNVAPGDDRLDLAEQSWKALIDTNFHTNPLLYVAMKVPTWAGLALALVSGARPVARERSRSRVSPRWSPSG